MALELAIVYDSEGLQGYETGWGYSVLITSGDERTLFDCGWDGHVLRRNLGRLGVSFADIDKIVLSHAHWDHISGLTNVLDEPMTTELLEVFVPSSFSENLKREISRRAELVEVDGPREISKGVSSTGQLGRGVKEQSLVLSVDGRSLVLTGCAHPGVGAIFEAASKLGDPTWLMGGLHDAAVRDIPTDMDKVVPCHCTRDASTILEAFGARAHRGRAGDVFALSLAGFDRV